MDKKLDSIIGKLTDLENKFTKMESKVPSSAPKVCWCPVYIIMDSRIDKNVYNLMLATTAIVLVIKAQSTPLYERHGA